MKMPFAASESGKKPTGTVSKVCHVNKKARTGRKGKDKNCVDVTDFLPSDMEEAFSRDPLENPGAKESKEGKAEGQQICNCPRRRGAPERVK